MACVHSKDLEFLRMSRQELDAEMQLMLSDLEVSSIFRAPGSDFGFWDSYVRFRHSRVL